MSKISCISLVLSLSLLCLVHATYAAESTKKTAANEAALDIVEIDRSFQGNMLTNGDFKVMKPGQSVPDDWFEMNPLQTKAVQYKVKTDPSDHRKYVQITSKEDAPAYIGQVLKVEEGKRYYCAIASRFDGSCEFLLRVYTDQFADKGSWADKSSNTEVRDCATPGQGEGLEDFLDAKFLNPVRKDKWAIRELEFTVPAGHNVDTYYFTCGIYGYGWTDLSYAYAGPAEVSVSLQINSPNLKCANLYDLTGKFQHYWDLSENGPKIITMKLPSRLIHYYLEITDNNDRKYRRAI